jgi:aminopeptidase N
LPTLTVSDHLTEQEAADRAALVSGVSYDVDLDIGDDRVDASGNPVAETFRSTTRIAFDGSRDAAETFLNINASALIRLTFNGTELQSNQYTFENSRLTLRGLRAGRNQVEVVADCAYQKNGVGLHRFVDPVDRKAYVYTHFEPFDAHRVFACFDQPDLKARIRTTVRAPQSWEVCGNGRVLERIDNPDGTRTWRFNETPPISTYLMAFAGAEYHVVAAEHKGIDMRLYCRTSMAKYLDEQAEEIFEVTRQGLDFFERDFGFEYPFDEYNQLFVPEFNMGAMENPGCVTFNESYVFRARPTELQRARKT